MSSLEVDGRLRGDINKVKGGRFGRNGRVRGKGVGLISGV